MNRWVLKKGSKEAKSRNHSCVGLELSSALAYRSSQKEAWPSAAPSSVFGMMDDVRFWFEKSSGMVLSLIT